MVSKAEAAWRDSANIACGHVGMRSVSSARKRVDAAIHLKGIALISKVWKGKCVVWSCAIVINSKTLAVYGFVPAWSYSARGGFAKGKTVGKTR